MNKTKKQETEPRAFFRLLIRPEDLYSKSYAIFYLQPKIIENLKIKKNLSTDVFEIALDENFTKW